MDRHTTGDGQTGDNGERPITLLLVDNRPDNLSVVKQLLSVTLPNCQILTAASGEEGLLTAAGNSLDGALVDVQMPGMGGIEMCRQLKANHATSRIPVILMTAHSANPAMKAEGLEAGADDFVNKPIENSELTAKIRVMLRIKRVEDELRNINASLEDKVRARTKDVEQSEAKWRCLVDSAPDIILMLDRGGKILFINRTVDGSSVEETIGRSVYDYVPPERHDLTRESIEKVFLTGQAVGFETPITASDGVISWYSTRLAPNCDAAGQITGVVLVFRDITDERARQKERERLHHSLNERVKELRCMRRTAQSVRERETLEEIFLDVVAIIPSGWRFPEIARSRIVFDGTEYVSEPFEETQWKQSGDIVVGGESRGVVEVYYLEDRPHLDEGPFVREERSLIDSLARTLGEVIDHKRSEKALQQRMDELEQFNRLVVGREERMIELKGEVNEMARKAGVSPPYDLAFAESSKGVTDDEA